MAKKQHTEAADAAENAAPSVPEHENVGLVAMTKDGAMLDVHPSCVAAHERAGWKVKG